jgi:hypothetical protein
MFELSELVESKIKIIINMLIFNKLILIKCEPLETLEHLLKWLSPLLIALTVLRNLPCGKAYMVSSREFGELPN